MFARSCGRGFRLVAIAIALALAGASSVAQRQASRGRDSAPRTSSGSGGVNRLEHRHAPYVVLISLDGFRADYPERFDLPNVRRLMRRGTRAAGLVPVFPTLTFPNHYSLVTGLYPDRHGIVANSFYDPARRQEYSLGDSTTVADGSWYRGEPIWVTAERQGMVSACFFWPGSEAAIHGVRPTFFEPYDAAVSDEVRVRTVLDWLRLPDDRRPHIVTLYFSRLDTASHRNPLDSPDVARAAASLDGSLGALLDGLEGLAIGERVYVLVTSDHGMVETSHDETIRLDRIIDLGWLEAGFGGPVANLHVRGGPARARQIRERLNAQLKHGRAYLRAEVPDRYRYRADPRVGDVIVVMDESWMLVTPGWEEPRRARRWGMHGWPPELASMRAVFIAAGPGVRAGATIPDVRNVDVYPLMTELLGLEAARPIDGLPDALRTRIMK